MMTPQMQPFWFEDGKAPQSPPFVPPPPEADVVIVGGGLTGLSAARALAKRGRHVVVVDAGAPGGGASGRNGGMLGGGHRLEYQHLRARYGDDLAQRLLREAHLDSAAFVKNLIAEENIDCDFVECGRFRGAWTQDEYKDTARQLKILQDMLSLEADMLPKQRQHEEVATDLYEGGTVFFRHCGLHPAKYVRGLLHAAQRAGATVIGDLPVIYLSSDKGAVTVHTAHGRIRAGQVLLAVNGYVTSGLPYWRRRIVPIPSFIVATAPLGRKVMRTLIPGGRMIVESRFRHCFYRASPDGERLIFGGRAAMYNGFSDAFIRRQMRKLMADIFPSLGDVDLSHQWRGLTGFSFDLLPNVGQCGNIWHAMGYCGSGNAMAPWLGYKAAMAMLGDAEGDTAFRHTKMSTRWWHRGTPWFMPFADVVYRLQDLRDGRRPRRRLPS